MAKYYINSLSIEGFRGINNEGNPLIIDFKHDGVTSFFGENGMGKSSIFEALLFSVLGRIIRFDDYHRDILDSSTIKNLFHTGDGTINIEFIDDSNIINEIKIIISINGERIISSTTIPNPEDFLISLCSSLNFLDYKSFEKIILTSSEETGKLFSNLVGFGSFINIKDKLDKISRTQNINNDFGKSAKETIIRNNNLKISELKSEIIRKLHDIGIEASSYVYTDILKILNLFLKKQYSIKLNKITNKDQIDFDQLIKLKFDSNYEENISILNSKQENLNEVILKLKQIQYFNKRILNNFTNKLRTAYKQILTENDIVLGKLFDEAIKSYNILIDFDKNTCVLCETGNLGKRQNTFYDQIISKLKSYSKFKEKYYLFFNEFKQKIQLHNVIEIEKKYLLEENQIFDKIVNSHDYIDKDYLETNRIEDLVLSLKQNLQKEIVDINNSIKELKAKIPPKISELVDIHNTYKLIFHSIIEINNLEKENDYNNKYLVELENWIRYIIKIKEDYEDAYNILMNDIATMIDTDTKLFFKEIMGNVEITPKLRKENKGQKVNILLERFYSNTDNLKAAPLLSESYRNALCLSIYFATALKSKNPGNFIILDDITSSFDSGHQLYLLDLIKTKIAINPSNKKGKQIILLTHDGLLKKVLNENGNSKYWKHYSLNFNKDIVSLKPFLSEDLKNVIQNKITNNNYIGSDFRLFYEFVLMEIIENLNLEIPYSLIQNNDEKMVNKLVMAIAEIVELKRKAGKVRSSLNLPAKADFKLHTQQLSNNLSHWASASTASLSTAVLNRIINDIELFKRKFQYNCTCSLNAGWIYYKSLSSPKQKGCNCPL